MRKKCRGKMKRRKGWVKVREKAKYTRISTAQCAVKALPCCTWSH